MYIDFPNIVRCFFSQEKNFNFTKLVFLTLLFMYFKKNVMIKTRSLLTSCIHSFSQSRIPRRTSSSLLLCFFFFFANSEYVILYALVECNTNYFLMYDLINYQLFYSVYYNTTHLEFNYPTTLDIIDNNIHSSHYNTKHNCFRIHRPIITSIFF